MRAHDGHRLEQISFAGNRDALVELGFRLAVTPVIAIVGGDHAGTKRLKRLVLQALGDGARVLHVAKTFLGVAVLDEHCTAVGLRLRGAQFLTP